MAAAGTGAYESNGNLDSISSALGAKADAKVTDPTLSASEIALLKGILYQLQNGGTSGTQYTDGSVTPTHPVGTEIVFNNAGTMTAVSNSNGLPINGSITASNPSVGTDGGAIPTSSTLIGVSDGTNLQQLLAEVAANPNLRVALYSAGTKLIGQKTMAGSLPVTLASDQGAITANAGTNLNTSALALETGGNLATLAGIVSSAKAAVKAGTGDIVDLATIAGAITAAIMQSNVKQINGVTPLMGNGTTGTGSQRVTIASDNTAFSVNSVQSGTWTVQPGNTANSTPWLVQDVVASSGGSVPYHNLSAASTNFTNVKGAACQLYSMRISNTSGSAIYVKVYDKATAPTTSDTPKDTLMVNATTLVVIAIPEGMKFTTGFGWSATGAVADNDNTNIAANCIIDFSLNS